ncbi:MAG TPA: hypothetical protein VK090_03000 [Paracoccaceae bacterium]|nr:hypothetical protein [Paracoccaceae bacterium]
MANIRHLKLGRGAALLAGALLLASIASAEPAGEVEEANDTALSIELNRLDAAENTCKASLVVSNGTGTGFESLVLDLVMFDSDGIIAGRMAVELAPLPPAKTSVRAFSLGGMECESVGRVLLNTVVACETAEGEQDRCLEMIRTSSRTDVPFIE